MKTTTQMLIFLIAFTIVILCSFDFLLQLDNRRRIEREVVITLPEQKLDTIIIIDKTPQYDYE